MNERIIGKEGEGSIRIIEAANYKHIFALFLSPRLATKLRFSRRASKKVALSRKGSLCEQVPRGVARTDRQASVVMIHRKSTRRRKLDCPRVATVYRFQWHEERR